MDKKFFWLSILAVIISFGGGFLLANALNRSEISTLQAENARLKTAQDSTQQNEAELSLSGDEIKQKIAEADRNPTNFAYQKSLGIALYNYASMKQDIELLGDIARILTRVYDNNPKDADVAATLGNINFDIGYAKKNDESFQKAREFYQKSLNQKPNDANVRADVGLTYFLANPPETDKAITELQKSLAIDPKHEKSLQAMTQVLISQNKNQEASKYLAQLKTVNPNNSTIPGFTEQINQSQGSTQK